MALKDWNLKSNLMYVKRYVNQISQENLVIEKDPVIYSWTVKSWKLSVKRFKNYSSALTFAKKYMERN